MSDDSVSLRPGSPITFIDVNGNKYDDTIHSIHFRSAEAEIRKRPTGWRKTLRILTPKQWRKPLPILQPYKPSNTEIVCMGDRARRAELMAEAMRNTFDRILDQSDTKPK